MLRLVQCWALLHLVEGLLLATSPYPCVLVALRRSRRDLVMYAVFWVNLANWFAISRKHLSLVTFVGCCIAAQLWSSQDQDECHWDQQADTGSEQMIVWKQSYQHWVRWLLHPEVGCSTVRVTKALENVRVLLGYAVLFLAVDSWYQYNVFNVWTPQQCLLKIPDYRELLLDLLVPV